MNEWWEQDSKMGVLASGGAPNLHLVAGSLCAFYKNEISFDVIGASGAGALPGLLYAVPKIEGGQVAALEDTVNINVSDAIYELLPMNYKVFFKRGPLTNAFWQLNRFVPHEKLRAADRNRDTLQRLYNDSIDFCLSALTPTTLNYFSKSLCTRTGAIEDRIAWDRLPSYPGEYFLNAFDLTTQRLELFNNQTLTPETFWAALAMPWLYDPVSIDGKTYTEGASHDPTGLEALWQYTETGVNKLDKIIALDTIGPELWTNPENIYEALQIAIIDPIVSIDEYVLAAYGMLEYFEHLHGSGEGYPKLYHVPFDVPTWEAPQILSWSYSNALTLWDTGHAATMQFIKALKSEHSHPQNLEKYRYYPSMKDRPQVRDFLRLFDDLVRARFPGAVFGSELS